MALMRPMTLQLRVGKAAFTADSLLAERARQEAGKEKG